MKYLRDLDGRNKIRTQLRRFGKAPKLIALSGQRRESRIFISFRILFISLLFLVERISIVPISRYINLIYQKHRLIIKLSHFRATLWLALSLRNVKRIEKLHILEY